MAGLNPLHFGAWFWCENALIRAEGEYVLIPCISGHGFGHNYRIHFNVEAPGLNPLHFGAWFWPARLSIYEKIIES